MRISLEQMEFTVPLGHIREEHIVGTRIEVDLSFESDTSKSEETDELSDTVDYKAVFDAVREEVMKPTKLVEHLARRVMDRVIKDFPNAYEWELELTKLNPPVNGQLGNVTISLEG